jgi:hypothetical protein
MRQKPHIARIEEISCRLNVLFGNLLTSRHKKEDNIERCIKGARYEYMDWFQMVSYKALFPKFSLRRNHYCGPGKVDSEKLFRIYR